MKTRSFEDLIVWQKAYRLVKEYRQYLSVAYGSLCELRTQTRLSVDLEYVKETGLVLSLAEEVSKMLFRMIHPVR